jgi:hypothetical protein
VYKIKQYFGAAPILPQVSVPNTEPIATKLQNKGEGTSKFVGRTEVLFVSIHDLAISHKGKIKLRIFTKRLV